MTRCDAFASTTGTTNRNGAGIRLAASIALALLAGATVLASPHTVPPTPAPPRRRRAQERHGLLA